MRALYIIIASFTFAVLCTAIYWVSVIYGAEVLLHLLFWIGAIGFFIWFFKKHSKEFLDSMNSPLKASDVMAAWGVAVMIALLVLVSSCMQKRDEFWIKTESVVYSVQMNGPRSTYIVATCKDGSRWYTRELDYFNRGDVIHYYKNTSYGKDEFKLIKITKK